MKRFQKVTTMLCSVQATLLIATTNVLAKSPADQYLNPQWGNGKAPKNTEEIWNAIFKIFQGLVTGVTGVMTIIMVGIFFYRCFKLASVSDNPRDRSYWWNSTNTYWSGTIWRNKLIHGTRFRIIQITD